jgi:hypothetical protein
VIIILVEEMISKIYSLDILEQSSDKYYSEISDFTDVVVERSQGAISSLIRAYINYLSSIKKEKPREYEEYLLDFLCFGILWKSFSRTALSVAYAPFGTLAKMSHWRKLNKFWKPTIDTFRGICFTLFMLPDEKVNGEFKYPTKRSLSKFFKWMAATGEYNEQVLRLRTFKEFYQTILDEEATYLFKEIIDFSDWFEAKCNKELGKYTPNVDEFLEISKTKFIWREDRIQCSAPRLEYHFNMVGAELMNRAFRTEFNETTRTAILLPGCMRKHTDEQCTATEVERGHVCMGCSRDCAVNRLRIMGKKKKFEVFIIPHSSELSQWSSSEDEEKLGVIASACVTSLVEGGLELRRYGVPAQCVLLDYSGCSKHWHPEGLTTELNIDEMVRILNRDEVLSIFEHNESIH